MLVRKLFALLRDRGLISDQRIDMPLSWQHSGFRVHNHTTFYPAGTEGMHKLSAYRVVQLDPSMVFAAIALHEKEKTSFRDALIVRAALESGCELLMSEDMQHGRRFENLRVDNPFL